MEESWGRESLWALARDAIFPPSAIEAGPLQVAAILSMLPGAGPLDVLDLPCGPGRHALPLARLGHRVVAVDRTPSYLDELRAAAGDLALEVVQADMRAFVRDDAFDLALNLYHSFGYFEDPEDDARVLANLRRSVRSGGALVMDLHSRELMERGFEPVRERALPDGSTVREVSSIEGDWMASTWTLIRDGEEHARDMSLRLYSAESLRAALAVAGFEAVTLFGGFDWRPWDADAVRLVVLAR